MKSIDARAVIAVVASECPEIENHGDTPSPIAIVKHGETVKAFLETLGCRNVETVYYGHNNNLQSDSFATVSHVVGLVPPSSVDIDSLRESLCTNDTTNRTGFYPVVVQTAATILAER